MFARLSICLLLSLCLTVGATAQTSDSTYREERLELLRAGQAFLLDELFDEADSVYALFADLYPSDPAGPLYRAAVRLAAMNDAEDPFASEDFGLLLDSVETLTDDSLAADSSERAWLYLMRGNSYAYRSIYESHFGSLLTAVRRGFSARNCYSDALKQDSTLYDIYLGLGSYHYWKSAKGGFLRMIRILSNDRARGIRELRLAEDSALYSRDAAYSALIWIFLDEKKYDSAIVRAQKMRAEYPDGRSFYWPLARAYAEKGMFAEAVDLYRILRSYFDEFPGNYYNLIEIDYALCRLAEKMNHKETAAMQAVESLEYLPLVPEDISDRQRSKIDYLIKRAK